MQLVCVGGHFTWGAPSEATALGSPQLHSITAVFIGLEGLLLLCFSRRAYVELHGRRMYQPPQLPPPWRLESELWRDVRALTGGMNLASCLWLQQRDGMWSE